jgi:hypothetical protein
MEGFEMSRNRNRKAPPKVAPLKTDTRLIAVEEIGVGIIGIGDSVSAAKLDAQDATDKPLASIDFTRDRVEGTLRLAYITPALVPEVRKVGGSPNYGELPDGTLCTLEEMPDAEAPETGAEVVPLVAEASTPPETVEAPERQPEAVVTSPEVTEAPTQGSRAFAKEVLELALKALQASRPVVETTRSNERHERATEQVRLLLLTVREDG